MAHHKLLLGGFLMSFFKNKFVVIKKENILSVLLCAAAVVCAAEAVQKISKADLAKETFALPVSNKIIVIDPGHGGIDAGASAGGVKEKDLNLDIAKKLAALVEQSGGTAILTRSDDFSTADKNRDKSITQKKSDLTERKKLVEKYNADMFISIHMNKFSSDKYSGAQVFYNQNSKESAVLAKYIQNAFKKYLDKSNNRLEKAENNIFVLKNANAPAVLAECGFLSSPEELKKLSTEDYRQKVARAIFMGITEYEMQK